MRTPRAAGLIATAVLVSLWHVHSGAALISRHVGPTNPTTESFTQFSTFTATGPVVNDGIERLTGYPGNAQFLERRSAPFGANGATATFNRMKLEVPATAANSNAPTTSFAAWRAGAPTVLTTVDLEGFATGTLLTGTEYAGLGLSIVQRDGDPMRIGSAGDGSFISTANVSSPTHVLSSSAIPGFSSGYDGSRSENYDFIFANPIRAAGLWVGNLNPGFNTVAVEFLDAAGGVIATQPLNTLDSNLIRGAGQYDNRLFVGINSVTPVKRIRVNNADGDQDGIVFDDVVFEPPGIPVPSLTSLSPSSAGIGAQSFTLTVNGSNFVNGAEVRWNGAARATTFVAGSQLRATIPASDIAATGTASVTVVNPSPGGDTSNALAFTTKPTVSLDKTKLTFGAVTSGQTFLFQTAAQVVRLAQTGSGPVTWTATSNQPWLQVSPSSGTGSASLSVSVRPAAGLPPAGKVTGAITFNFVGAFNTAGPITVNLNLLSGTSAAPFGFVDTPFDGSTGVTGAVPFTGWMLDDVEGVQVMICRDAVGSEIAPADPNCAGRRQIFVGFPIFIDVARPDVEGNYPEIPLNSRAGWGLMVLTNMLPSQGNGTFVFHMWGQDREGNTKLLGTRTITCDNAHATKPFGAIDTPTQGGLASGADFVNFGWVLTPLPKAIPIDGSTISVLVDGVVVGAASYNYFRDDIANAFPGLNNTNGAIGFRMLDTTTMTNGTHTIVWVVTDNQGVAEGIGSRYFNVSNGVGSLTASISDTLMAERSVSAPSTVAVDRLPKDTSLLLGREGWDLDAPHHALPVDGLDRLVVRSEEVNRIELQLGSGDYGGYVRAGGRLRSLPVGSRLDTATGTFTWAPGPGFVGTYDLVFVRHVAGRAVARREVRVALAPKGRGTAGRQVVIDAPTTQQDVGQPFAVAGWAADLDSPSGTGMGTLHVWAYPLAGGLPIFLGTAASGGARPDVAAMHGDAFLQTGFGLIVQGLAHGHYDLAVFAWSTEQMEFLPARTIRVTVR